MTDKVDCKPPDKSQAQRFKDAARHLDLPEDAGALERVFGKTSPKTNKKTGDSQGK